MPADPRAETATALACPRSASVPLYRPGRVCPRLIVSRPRGRNMLAAHMPKPLTAPPLPHHVRQPLRRVDHVVLQKAVAHSRTPARVLLRSCRRPRNPCKARPEGPKARNVMVHVLCMARYFRCDNKNVRYA